jgi:PAS domain S-box-containing protein
LLLICASEDAEVARLHTAAALPNFESLFRRLPSPYMVLDRSFNYVDANDAYCQVTERGRDELIGRNIFDLFPNPGESGRRLRESFERVIETGQPDSIPLLPYPIPLPLSRGGGMEMRYWSAAHVPLLDAQGRTAFVVQNTVDVTELQRLKEIAYGPSNDEVAPAERDLLQRTREVERANRLLQEETQGLRDLFMQAPGFMAVLSGPDLVFSLVNKTYQQLIGHRPVIGRTLLEALPEVRNQGFGDLLRGVMRTGEPFIGSAVSVMLQRQPGAALEERFVDFIYQPIRTAGGHIWGVFVEGSDVTDRVMAERQQKLLLDELNHRVKNTLATVQAIAAQTLRTNAEPAAFRDAFESRLIALSATHDLLTATNWRSAALRDVLLLELKPFGPERYQLEGPQTSLSPPEALTLGLLFHELATNAAKYGALSTQDGCVEVGWRVETTGEGAKLELDWIERGGPPVSPPTRRGFGSRLIERSLTGQMRGKAELEFAADGLLCRIVLPLRG